MSDPLISFDAEQQLVAELLFTNGLIDRATETLSADDFAEPVHGRIFAAMARQDALGKPSNAITLKSYFEGDEGFEALGGPGYMARLSGIASGHGALDLARMVADLASRRTMRTGLAEAMAACADVNTPPAEVASMADAALASRAEDSIAQPTGAESLAALLDSMGKPVRGTLCNVIPSLDTLLGPMRPKQLVIGAGRPGMGKTAMALSYSIGASMSGHGVLYVSLEMSAPELAARMAADICFNGEKGVPFSAIRDGDLNDWQKREVAKAASMMEGYPFQIVDAGGLAMGRLNSLVRRHKRRMAAKGHSLDLVVIDYLQLLSPDAKGRSNYEAVSEVSRGLKAMAKDHDVAVFALAQLSRTVETRPDKRPQLSDLRDSGQIEQDADAVLFLLREEYYLRQAEPEQMSPDRAQWEALMAEAQNKIEFIIAKRRNGVTGKAEGAFYGAYQAVRG